LGIESPARKFGAKFATMMLLAALALSVAACGGEDASGASGERSESAASQRKVEETTAAEKADTGAATSTEVAALARAGVGPREITSMLPADGKEPDPARPLPENPPEGIEVYPATTKRP
jgi:Flp pilus assembly protein TadD